MTAWRQALGALWSPALVVLAAGLLMLPIVWIVLAAFKHQVDVFHLRLFFPPTLDNFRTIFAAPYLLGGKLANSVVVAGATVLIALPLATGAAYAFSRFRLPGATALFVLILGTQFIPAVVVVLPYFVIFRSLGLLDTRVALIVINLSVVLPFAIWMIKGFIDGIPQETEEAALVDGSTRLQVIRNIALPMAAPGIVTAGIFSFILAWNDFIYALILTSREAVTMPVGLGLFNAETGQLWNDIAAAGIIILVPMFVLALLVQKHFVQGMTMGAVR